MRVLAEVCGNIATRKQISHKRANNSASFGAKNKGNYLFAWVRSSSWRTPLKSPRLFLPSCTRRSPPTSPSHFHFQIKIKYLQPFFLKVFLREPQINFKLHLIVHTGTRRTNHNSIVQILIPLSQWLLVLFNSQICISSPFKTKSQPQQYGQEEEEGGIKREGRGGGRVETFSKQLSTYEIKNKIEWNEMK